MTLPIFKLEDYLSHYEFKAPYLLCCSDAESFSLKEILALATDDEQKLWDNLHLGYTEAPGHPFLRETISKQLFQNLSAENILLTAGAEDGIFCAFSALCNPGDHVIVITPCYQSLYEIPKSKGCSITTIPLKEENNWRIDLNAIEHAIRPNTKWMVINFPHNPTGQVIRQEELLSLVQLLDRHGIWLFSDEAYHLLGSPKEGWAQPAACLYSRAISLGVMSKAYGLAGLRIGWIACQDTAVLKKIEHMKHYTSICCSAPSEILSIIALNHKDIILSRNNAIVKNNINILDQFFTQHSELFSWAVPEGGCIGFVKYHGPENIDDFSKNLVEEKGVLLLPANVYSVSTNHFRIGFGRKNMPEALNHLKDFLRGT